MITNFLNYVINHTNVCFSVKIIYFSASSIHTVDATCTCIFLRRKTQEYVTIVICLEYFFLSIRCYWFIFYFLNATDEKKNRNNKYVYNLRMNSDEQEK